MKKALIISVGVVLGAISILIFGYIVIIVFINWPDTPIARNISVTPEWTEINLDQPLTFAHGKQTLDLRIKDFQFDPHSKISEIGLPNGKLIQPEIEVYDEAGDRFTMRHTGYTRKYFEAIVFSPSSTVLVDKRYNKIRIRSDVPFDCEAIYWIDYSPP